MARYKFYIVLYCIVHSVRCYLDKVVELVSTATEVLNRLCEGQLS